MKKICLIVLSITVLLSVDVYAHLSRLNISLNYNMASKISPDKAKNSFGYGLLYERSITGHGNFAWGIGMDSLKIEIEPEAPNFWYRKETRYITYLNLKYYFNTPGRTWHPYVGGSLGVAGTSDLYYGIGIGVNTTNIGFELMYKTFGDKNWKGDKKNLTGFHLRISYLINFSSSEIVTKKREPIPKSSPVYYRHYD